MYRIFKKQMAHFFFIKLACNYELFYFSLFYWLSRKIGVIALASRGHPIEQTQCHMGSYTQDWNEVFPLCPALQNRFLC